MPHEGFKQGSNSIQKAVADAGRTDDCHTVRGTCALETCEAGLAFRAARKLPFPELAWW